MKPSVYINLPVADLSRSRRFFETLGFTFNDNFSDDTALGMEVNDHCSVMLLTHEKFASFTPREIADTSKTTEVLTCLQLATREAVDDICDKALKNGASYIREPKDHGFMYERAFADPDGHIWEVFSMVQNQ